MKKVNVLFYIGFFIILLSIVSCKKEAKKIADFSFVPGSQALLKINYVSSYATNPGVQLTLNDIRVSNVITARTPFPGGGYNTGGGSTPDYLSVNPGNIKVAVSIPKKGTNTDSLPLYTTNVTLEGGKNYTAHITDTAAKTKIILTVDDLQKPDTPYSKHRFINLMPNVAALDLYYGTTIVAANIPYLGVSNYFTIKVPTTALAWTIREAGALPTSPALATYTSASTTTNQRIYTDFAVGYKGATDAARKPYISFFLNY